MTIDFTLSDSQRELQKNAQGFADAVLRPTIEYARDGYPLVPRAVQAILSVRKLFEAEWTSSARVWLAAASL